jgi:hypothetical protein
MSMRRADAGIDVYDAANASDAPNKPYKKIP